MIFTPRTKTGERLKLDIVDTIIPRGRGWRKTFTEKETGKKYLCASANCGLPDCHCDAIVIKVIE